MDLRDFPGLMGQARAGRKAGWNAFIECLPFEDCNHRSAGVLVDGLAFRNGGQEALQRAGGGCVIQPLLIGLFVFHSAQDAHTIRAKGMNGSANVFDAELLDQQIGGEVAAPGDHQVA
jgi:hypothetical protein